MTKPFSDKMVATGVRIAMDYHQSSTEPRAFEQNQGITPGYLRNQVAGIDMTTTDSETTERLPLSRPDAPSKSRRGE